MGKNTGGKVLFYLGLAGLFLSLGSVAGYYFSDVGTPWLPTMLGGIVAFAMVSLCILLLGNMVLGKFSGGNNREWGMRRRVWLIACLLLVGAALMMTISWLYQPSPLTDLDRQKYNLAFSQDCEQYQNLNTTLNSMLMALENRSDIFSDEKVLTPEQEKWLGTAWNSIYHNLVALDRIRIFHEDYYRFDPSRLQRSYHLRSYLLTFAAELSLVKGAARLDHLFSKNPHAASFINSPRPAFDIPEASLQQVRRDLLGTRDQARVQAGSAYLAWLETGLGARADAQEMGLEWLWQDILGRQKFLSRYDLFDSLGQGLGGDSIILTEEIRRAWFPSQKGPKNGGEDPELRRISEFLIGATELQLVAKELESGDILLARKNWELSNVALPGFWPHVLIYLGNANEIEQQFSGNEIDDLLTKLHGEEIGIKDYLQQYHGNAWQQWQEQSEIGGTCVMEAISQGVLLRPLNSASGDYLAALRPNLSEGDRLQAIFQALTHLGKPYDHNYDFTTDHALVCTELIWRSYRPSQDKQGLSPPLVDIAGWMTLPANDLGQWYLDTKEQENPPLSFVLFIDASEKDQKAFLSDEAGFIQSIDRTKWEFGLE